jgi:hypothetical protein
MSRKKRSETLQLDSFLDIITNTIGILVVICCLAAINVNDITYIVRTPFVHKTEKIPLFFECRNLRCVPIDKEGLQNEIDKRIQKLYKKNVRLTGTKILSLLEDEEIGDNYYNVNLPKLFLENIFVLIPKGEEIGESKTQIRKPDSIFVETIKDLDPEKYFIFFLVRPDSFGIYREARKILWDHGIEIGWEPLTSGKFVSFGTRGRKPKVE